MHLILSEGGGVKERGQVSVKILEVLAKEGRPLTWKEIVKKTQLPKATVTHALNRLKRFGLVKPQLMEDEKVAWSLSRDEFLETLEMFLEGKPVLLTSVVLPPPELMSGKPGFRYDMLLDLVPEKVLERRERLRTALSMIIERELTRGIVKQSLRELDEEELAKLAREISSNISRSIEWVLERMLFKILKEAEAEVQKEMKKRGDEVEHYSGRLWKVRKRSLYL